MPRQSYPAKLLLFGEQTVLRGSNAFAIPFPTFSGHWAYSQDHKETKQQQLPDLFNYLKKQQKLNTLSFELDFDLIKLDLEQGLYFSSNIPTGYGAGSSGALCAAIYDRFVENKLPIKKDNLIELKQTLAQLENYFHGKSSGTDPLIIYLNQPILIDADHGIIPTQLNRRTGKEEAYQYFLIDTQLKRKTETYVNIFLKSFEQDQFKEMIINQLTPAVNNAILAFQEDKDEDVFEQMKEISFLQLNNFETFIPKPFLKTWKSGLEKNDYYLKLCGAGGGGFLLGIKRKGFPLSMLTNKGFKVIELAI